MKKLIFIFAIVLAGCSSNNPVQEQDLEWPTTEFVHPPSFVMQYFDYSNVKMSFSIHNIKVAIDYSDIGKRYNWLHRGKKQEIYRELCAKNNDTSFQDSIRNPRLYVFDNKYIGCPSVNFKSIKIVSDFDWDEEHPANTSLGDIMDINFWTASIFIDSDYTHLSRIIKGDLEVYDGLQQRSKRVADINSEDLRLAGNNFLYPISGSINEMDFVINYYSLFTLSFQYEPKLSKVHYITITLTAEDGRVFEKTGWVSWE